MLNLYAQELSAKLSLLFFSKYALNIPCWEMH